MCGASEALYRSGQWPGVALVLRIILLKILYD